MDSIISLVIMCAAAFAGQLALCIKGQKWITRLLPVIILTGIEIVCGIIVIAVGDKTEVGTVVSMYALSQMVICGALLIPADLAWVVYGIIRLVKKLQNKSQV